MLVSRCLGWYSDQDDKEGDQGRPKSDLAKCRKSSSVAIEEEAEDVRDLVPDKHVPGMDRTIKVSAI